MGVGFFLGGPTVDFSRGADKKIFAREGEATVARFHFANSKLSGNIFLEGN